MTMKKICCLILMLLAMSSCCFPPRIIYALDDQSFVNNNDSIDIRLRKGSTTSLDGMKLRSNLSIDLWNKTNTPFILKKVNGLEARTDSVTLHYKLSEAVPLPCILEPNSKMNVFFMFLAQDNEYYLYKSVNNKKKHFLYLNLGFQNMPGGEINRIIVFRFTKTKRLISEDERGIKKR